MKSWYEGLNKPQKVFVYICSILLIWFIGVTTKSTEYRWLWALSFIPLVTLIYLKLGRQK